MVQNFESKKDLIGRIFEHEWISGSNKGIEYRIRFLDEKELEWTCLKGYSKGKSCKETYNIQKPADGIYTFFWKSQDEDSFMLITYNFNDMSAYGVVSQKEKYSPMKGNLKIIKP